MRAYPFAHRAGSVLRGNRFTAGDERLRSTDFLAGDPPGTIAAAFHNTLAEATAQSYAVRSIAMGTLPVVASGGCFQNARLAETISALARARNVAFICTALCRLATAGIALGQVGHRGGRYVLRCARARRRSRRPDRRRRFLGCASAGCGSTSWIEPVAPGDYVLNHVGFAIRRIPPEDIATTLASTNSYCKAMARRV